MSEHTLGPWKFEKLLAGAWNIQGGPNAYYPVCSRLSTVEHMEQESYANAHLIAQAWTIPQLRAALKAGLKSLEEIGGFMEAEYGPAPVLEQMRAALKLGEEG